MWTVVDYVLVILLSRFGTVSGKAIPAASFSSTAE